MRIKTYNDIITSAYLKHTQHMPDITLTYICLYKRINIRSHSLMPYTIHLFTYSERVVSL